MGVWSIAEHYSDGGEYPKEAKKIKQKRGNKLDLFLFLII